MPHTQKKTKKSIAKKNVSSKYMSLKDIDNVVANPNFGKNIEIYTGYSSYPDSRLGLNVNAYTSNSAYFGESQDLNYNYNYNYNVRPSVFPKLTVFTGSSSYLGESLNLDYNLKPPLYAVPIPPLVYNHTVSVIDCIETPFIKTKKGISIQKGSNVLIKKTYNQYKICINHKGIIKKIFKINGNWYFFVEIENEEIRKQIIEIHNYLEKNNNKKFKYPFFKDINQEKSWIVIPNKTEYLELIESNNESIVASTSTTLVATTSTNTSSSAAHYDYVNANILAAKS